MIKIITLLENTSFDKSLNCKHGLSFYIETNNHKILFDVGPNGLYYRNAIKLGVKIEDVDTLVLSHGHYDHGGGLSHFLSANKKAKIYVKEGAFDEHFTKNICFYINIGIKNQIDENRLILTKNNYKIDEEIELFSGVESRKMFSSMNNTLYTKKDGKYLNDNFEHEQYLVISNNDSKVLLTGCSHNGIVNIVEKFDELYPNTNLKAVIGGFHLFDPVRKKYENKERILELANWLNNRKENYYTCHCTGKKSFEIMKNTMKAKLSYACTGFKLEI